MRLRWDCSPLSRGDWLVGRRKVVVFGESRLSIAALEVELRIGRIGA